LKKVSFVLALLGVVLGTILVGAFGFRRVTDTLLSVGVAGFAVVVVWQFLLFIPLGLGWEVLARALGVRRAGLFIWGRMVRDCSTNLLPFSQLGGFFFGARAVMLHGLAWPEATATTVVDLTAEFIAEVVFAAIGLVILLVKDPNTDIRVPLEVGIGFSVLAATGFIWLQRGASGLFAGLSSRIAARQLSGARQTMSVLRQRMNTIYDHRGYLFLGFFWHLAGWIATGVGGWIAFRLLGARLDVAAGIAIESLVAAIAAVTFLVPVSAGVQEAGYTALGALFGVPAQLSLAVSLLRRSRDIVVGVPILLVWQAMEAKRLRVSVVNRQSSGEG
jgi:glycosyltransferase 2 family protein